MASSIALDASPAAVMSALRGEIVHAALAYPDVLHVEIRDPHGDVWRLATQDAEWSPSDPAELVGRSVDRAEIDETSGRLRCALSDGAILDIRPESTASAGDPPSWELIGPTGIVLEFGPGVRWQISSADAPSTSRPAQR